DAHAVAERILAQREFHSVKSQSWVDQQKARFWAAVNRMLYRLFGSAASWNGWKFVVYTIVGSVFVFFVWWIWRILQRGAPEQLSLEGTPAISDKHPAQWLAEARSAAERGQWREAVHLGYWAGISSLEAQGLWRPDRARTPREYLRLLGKQSSLFPSLLTLTRHLERIWYGGFPPPAAAFTTPLRPPYAPRCRGSTDPPHPAIPPPRPPPLPRPPPS